jgi:hypothetical protein
MTQKQMAKRIKDLEEAILQISAHLSSVLHHSNRIRMICEEFFSADEIATWPGKNPVYAKDLIKVLKGLETKKARRLSTPSQVITPRGRN